jgi:hypothetical protein
MYRPRASLGPEELLGGLYYYWSGAVRADFVIANFGEYPFLGTPVNRDRFDGGFPLRIPSHMLGFGGVS